MEALLAETDGAGAFTWIWSANPTGTLRLLIDDAETPALEMPFAQFLNAWPWPFSARTAEGHNLHLPIIHRRQARLVVRAPRRADLAGLFYQVAWRALDARQNLRPFTGLNAVAKPDLRDLALLLQPPPIAAPPPPLATLAPGASLTVLETRRAGCVERLIVRAATPADLDALWIEAWWDDETAPALAAPATLLAGVSAKGESAASLPVTVRNGLIEWRWPMPFQRGARVRITNRSDQPVQLGAAAMLAPVPPAPDSLCLRAFYQRVPDLDLTGRTVLTTPTLTGAGRLAGGLLRIDSRSPAWWGEGDPVFWLDELATPVVRGTGTEDYFGFAWCSDRVFAHPLRGQNRADGSRGARRIAAMYRYHLPDTIVFHSHARFGFEAWGLEPGRADYELLWLWYGPPATRGPTGVATD